MVRLARVVVAVIRTMSPSAAMAARTLFGDADYALYRDLLAGALRRGRGRGVGLVPDAEPRAPHPRAAGCRRAAPRARPRAPPLCGQTLAEAVRCGGG